MCESEAFSVCVRVRVYVYVCVCVCVCKSESVCVCVCVNVCLWLTERSSSFARGRHFTSALSACLPFPLAHAPAHAPASALASPLFPFCLAPPSARTRHNVVGRGRAADERRRALPLCRCDHREAQERAHGGRAAAGGRQGRRW